MIILSCDEVQVHKLHHIFYTSELVYLPEVLSMQQIYSDFKSFFFLSQLSALLFLVYDIFLDLAFCSEMV